MKQTLALMLTFLAAMAAASQAQTLGRTGPTPQLGQTGPLQLIKFPTCPPGFYNTYAKADRFICEIQVVDGTTQGQAIGARFVDCDPTDYWNRHNLHGFKKNGITHYRWQCAHQG